MTSTSKHVFENSCFKASGLEMQIKRLLAGIISFRIGNVTENKL
jgi:hypothetical protein